jgi:hypothetical protein
VAGIPPGGAWLAGGSTGPHRKLDCVRAAANG